MADKAIEQMISAFATGSLDKENFIQFRNYVQKGGDIPDGELGVQQNVMSLIPIILEIEQPDERIKEQVAKKIIEIQEKIKPRDIITTENKLTPAIKPPPEEPSEQEDKKRGELKKRPLHDSDKPRPASTGPPVTKESAPVKTVSSRGSRILVVAMLIIIIATTMYFMKLNYELEEQVVEIRNQLASFQSEIANTNEFINDHLGLIEFFNYKDVKIVNLLPMDATEGAWGRLLISFKSGEGMLQLKNMPLLEGEEVYQLWMVSKDATYSLSTIFARNDVKYYKISNIPYLPERDVNLFRITKENREGVLVPEGTAYLYGIFLKETNRRRR